jgi:signal peptidase
MSTIIDTERQPEPVVQHAHVKPRKRAWRIVESAVIFVVAIVILWPAQFGGLTGLTVVSGHSMEPTYHTGDLVVSLRQLSYAPGDIVSYKVPAGQAGEGGRVIHRIFSIDSSTGAAVYSTKGDNNPSVDPWHFGTNDVMGHALFSIPSMGSVLGGVTNPIVVGLASGLLVTILLWRIGSAPKKHRHRRSP